MRTLSTWCGAGALEPCLQLAEILLQGSGLPADTTQAVLLLQRHCGTDFGAPACDRLASLGPRDGFPTAAAVAGLNGQCIGGLEDACRRLVRIGPDGWTALRVLNEATAASEQLCMVGDEEGCLGLVKIGDVLLASGDGRGALNAYRSACILGRGTNCARYVELASRRGGQPPLMTEDDELLAYREACGRGYPGGCTALWVRFRAHWAEGGEQQDRAVAIVRSACEGTGRLADACGMVGWAYEQRANGAPDTTATRYYRRACRKGSEWGCGQLAGLLFPPLLSPESMRTELNRMQDSIRDSTEKWLLDKRGSDGFAEFDDDDLNLKERRIEYPASDQVRFVLGWFVEDLIWQPVGDCDCSVHLTPTFVFGTSGGDMTVRMQPVGTDALDILCGSCPFGNLALGIDRFSRAFNGRPYVPGREAVRRRLTGVDSYIELFQSLYMPESSSMEMSVSGVALTQTGLRVKFQFLPRAG